MTKITMHIIAFLAIALAIPTLAVAQSTTQPSTPATPNAAQQPSAQQPNQQPNMQQPNPANQAPPPGTNQSTGSAASSMGTQAQNTLSGAISADGKTFTSSNGAYQISNPNSVKVYANQPVSVRYHLTGQNSIHIDNVIPSQLQR